MHQGTGQLKQKKRPDFVATGVARPAMLSLAAAYSHLMLLATHMQTCLYRHRVTTGGVQHRNISAPLARRLSP